MCAPRFWIFSPLSASTLAHHFDMSIKPEAIVIHGPRVHSHYIQHIDLSSVNLQHTRVFCSFCRIMKKLSEFFFSLWVLFCFSICNKTIVNDDLVHLFFCVEGRSNWHSDNVCTRTNSKFGYVRGITESFECFSTLFARRITFFSDASFQFEFPHWIIILSQRKCITNVGNREKNRILSSYLLKKLILTLKFRFFGF